MKTNPTCSCCSKPYLKSYGNLNAKSFSSIVIMIIIICTANVYGQSYVPITVSGFNSDLVANGVGTVIATTTNGFDSDLSSGNNFYEHGYSTGLYGLPTSQIINSVSSPGVNYQLANYTGNNALLLVTLNQTGTLTLDQPGAFDKISILAASAGTPSQSTSFTATINFSDATNTMYSFSVPDWFDAGTYAITGLDRVSRTGVFQGINTNPKLFDCLITLNAADKAKVVTSITIKKTVANDRTGIFGICGITPSGTPSAVVVTAASAITSTSFSANWNAATGTYPATSYRLDVSTNSAFSSYVGVFNNYDAGNVTTFNVSSLTANTTYYYRVRGVNAAGQGPNSNVITATTSAGGPPPDPTGINGNNLICPGASTTLYVIGGLGTVYWYTGSCGGTQIGMGNSITVSPSVMTTYYARNYYNAMYSAGCASISVSVRPNPVPTIQGPATACLGSTTNIYTTESGMTSYTWNITGGLITGGAGTDHVHVTWNTLGPVQITVSYYTAAGCLPFTPTVYPVTVVPLPIPTISGANPTCQGVNTTYSTEPGQNSYYWSIPIAGQIISGQGTSAITVKWNYSGQYSISVTYANANGCSPAAPATMFVYVNYVPVPSITGAASVCSNSGYETYTTQGNMTGYTWNVSSGGSIYSGQGTNSISVAWNSAGPQTVSVNYTNLSGCTAANPTVYNVTVNGPPSGSAGTITGPSTVCAPQQGVVFSVAQVAGATAYAWTLPAGAIITSSAYFSSITVNFSANAVSGTVSVMPNNLCGNGGPSPVLNLTVNALPGAAGAITGSSPVCANQQGIAFSVASISGATGYTWNLPAGATIATGANSNSITVNFGITSGNVTVLGTSSCGSGTVSPVYPVAVNPRPTTPVITASGFALTSSAASGNQWYKDGTAVSGATSQTYTVPAGSSGYYWVKVTLLGCISDESNHLYIQNVGIGENTMGEFNIYPVPNAGLFTFSISWPVEALFNISIYNDLGVMVKQLTDINVNGTVEKQIDLRPAQAGIYTVVFIHEKERVVRKIAVVR